MTAALARRLARDRRGVTVVEFALVVPVMLLAICTIGDLLYQAYVQSILDGAVQKAGRDSTLEDNAVDGSAIDARVLSAVQRVASNAVFDPAPVRRSYTTFALVKPEPFTDRNNDGIRQSGECYDDINGNGSYDLDAGRTGQGGANDVTKYTVTVSFPRLFPVAGMVGLSNTVTLSSTTLLKNQPYKTQSSYTIANICT